MSLENIKTSAQGNYLDPPVRQIRGGLADIDSGGEVLRISGRSGKQIQIVAISASSDVGGLLQLLSDSNLLADFVVGTIGGLVRQSNDYKNPLWACNLAEDCVVTFSGSATKGSVYLQYVYR